MFHSMILNMEHNFTYIHENKEYQVLVIYKRIKNIHYRYIGTSFVISCPNRTSIITLKSGLDKFAGKLISRHITFQTETDSYIYIFGEKYELAYPGNISVKSQEISFKTKDELHKKIKKFFLTYLTQITHKASIEMGAPFYTVKLRKMRSRLGSNHRKNKTITYSYSLIHFSEEIIKSVIIHELAHCFVFNHGQKFYDILYKYCPNYDECRRKLLKVELN